MRPDCRPETAAAGQILVEHDAERVEVGAGVERFAAQLFGSHVRQCARHRTRLTFGHSPSRRASPKSISLSVPSSQTKMFSGLMSRCSTPRACAASRARHSGRATGRRAGVCIGAGAALRHVVPQRVSRQQLHDQKDRMRVLILGHVEDSDDVGVRQLRRAPALRAENANAPLPAA